MPGPDVALLAAAVQQGGRLQLTAYDECADAVGAADLVAGHRHRVDARAGEVEGQLAEGLDGVGVHRDAVGVGDLDDLGDRLDRADLVVGPHHRDHGDAGGIALDGRAEGVDVEPTQVVDVDQLDLGALVGEPVQRVEDGVVLDRGAQDARATRVLRATCPEQALDGEVVRLRAARGEDDLARPAVQRAGDRLAGLLDHPSGVATGAVQGRRVADATELRGHRRCCFGEDRRGRRVVEIDGHRWSRLRGARGGPDAAQVTPLRGLWDPVAHAADHGRPRLPHPAVRAGAGADPGPGGRRVARARDEAADRPRPGHGARPGGQHDRARLPGARGPRGDRDPGTRRQRGHRGRYRPCRPGGRPRVRREGSRRWASTRPRRSPWSVAPSADAGTRGRPDPGGSDRPRRRAGLSPCAW